MKKQVKVVGAIIENDDQEILCALRSTDMAIPNMWEFPGGKIETNERIHEALEREINEELGCKIQAGSIFHTHVHEYDTFIIELICVTATIVEGSPEPKEHAKLMWLKKDNLDSLKWAPADIPAVEALIEKV
ncbi:(deoxy)nucleoside triphosphate pyrophosphohydrolase [Salisediminibacterium selenitireducens]|uniref:8-oxo-dGTP diphosphatase n=1 Tax=Bacillus selenitireducens (strain ATCC 700615 / DSM 15326 / MLS10) TaxID=439292 RepID=D6XYV6_BACIE|nr:(deoxy)nucleoside triphosphate pyrophosphohydrolase [Salisediminibacterium selenitireducens]ADH98264.1 NUDIX hydrolase [[Bacillus] selenitireducens MLS10]